MFNIGLGELMIVLAVAFIVVGPDDLPKVARWLGRALRKLRLFIRDFKKETGWDEVEKEVNDVRRDVKQTIREIDVSADLKDAIKDVKGEIDTISKDVGKDLKQIKRDMTEEVRSVEKDLKESQKSVEKAASEAKMEAEKTFGISD